MPMPQSAPPSHPGYWLMTSEPDEAAIDDLARAPRRVPRWLGVRNYQARNFMRDAMRLGEGMLFYHSSCAQPGVAGLVAIAGGMSFDTPQFDPASPYFDAKSPRDKPRWLQSNVKLDRQTRLRALAETRQAPELASMQVLQRGSRLFITPVTPAEWLAVPARLKA